MKKKRALNLEDVARILGKPSRELAERCPDLRTTYPSKPCQNLGCDWAVHEVKYMNCMFVASEAGPHTLEAIGDMMDITRERARQIEKSGLVKIRLRRQFRHEDAAVHQPSLAAGADLFTAVDQGAELSDEPDDVPAFYDRKLA